MKNLSPEQYLSHVGQQQQPPELPPTRSFWYKFWKCIKVLFLLFAIISILFGVYIFNNLRKISVNPFDLGSLASDNGRINVLILGVGDPGHAGEKLSDTNLVMSVDLETKKVAFLSIPRDLRVRIPGHGYNKINTANTLGGPGLAVQTVSEMLDQPIHYYIESDFSGLKNLVDAVGGVDVDVKTALVDREYPCEDDPNRACGLNIQPGLQKMDGTTALQYVRCRKGTCGNDFGRSSRQQEIIGLVADKLFKPQSLLNPMLLTQVTQILSTDIKTNMSANQLLRLADVLRKRTSTVNFVLSTSPGGLLINGPGSDLVPADGTFKAIRAHHAAILTDTATQP